MKHLPFLLAVLCAGFVSADSYRFDMGSADTPVANGYTRVTAQDVFGEGKAFGWERAPQMLVYRNEPTNPWFSRPESLEHALYSDGLLSLGENTFTFLVKPGRYAVTAIIGDLALGEGRPGNSIWANGVAVVANEATEAAVKAFTFAVEAPAGRIDLRFRADSVQRYATVEGVTAEPLAPGEAFTPSVRQYPEQPVTRETYLENTQRLQDYILADWEQAMRELRAEGVDLEAWGPRAAALRRRPDYREFWGWSVGGGSWERLAAVTGRLDLARLCAGFTEMGIDGFQTNSAAIIGELTRAGLKHAVSGGGENLPGGDYTGITLNLIRKPDGSTGTIDRVFSICAPEVVEVFRKHWRERLAAGAPGASFFLIDEPRGMWGSGGFGDYSAPAQAAFKRWCSAQGYADTATAGIPPPGRTEAFYRFYRFRLQAAAQFVKEFVKGTPAEALPVAPGNGDVGPEQMNHNSYWPPAMAQAGLISTCWAYHAPPSCKAYAETVAMAREFGGQSIIVPPLYPGEHTPVQALPMHTACLSAATTRVSPWHFGGPINGPDRPQWMKDVYYSARLTHATSGLAHTPPLYVWCPESIVYNDLVEQNRAEAEHWGETYRTLAAANVDYAVTNTLAVPAGAVVLYSCARPVLSAEEFARLRQFAARGGTLLCTAAQTPEYPDGRAIADWAKLPKGSVVAAELTAPGLRRALEGRARELNLPCPAGVNSYLYRRDGRRVHLLNNTDYTKPAALVLPAAMEDVLTGKALPRGRKLVLPPGLYALLKEQ